MEAKTSKHGKNILKAIGIRARTEEVRKWGQQIITDVERKFKTQGHYGKRKCFKRRHWYKDSERDKSRLHLAAMVIKEIREKIKNSDSELQ